ncbi:hypothetical protein TRIUR3_26357 [Triticum urartu]|uniref:Uncharacterized protein n=1 Tax=Triticum urartu TaxID=4572 RepID=M7Z368_TRIUA|nr:hypothetical protein TRIUR3_26357 [Triticum urartu]
MAFRARVETGSIPLGPSGKTCFDNIIKSTKAATASTGEEKEKKKKKKAPTAIRFFDEYSCYVREELENKEDGSGSAASGRKIFNPTCVAVGPRFHGQDGLKRGEELKRMAARDFWEYSDQPFSALYAQVREVATAARGSYASASSFTFTDDEFTAMMFVDGCFLLQLIALQNNYVDGGMVPVDAAPTFESSYLNQVGASTLLADIFMVENQIPWAVLHALMSIRPVQVMLFVDAHIASTVDVRSARPEPPPGQPGDYGPIHLLDLLWKRHVGPAASLMTVDTYLTYKQLEVATLTSATELAEAGVDICPSSTTRFADISFGRRWQLFGRLSLPPFILDHTNVALLLNMLTFELFYWDNDHNRSNVAAYFGMLSALMIREEDVRQLRRKGIVVTTLSDKEVIKLFNKLGAHTNGRNAQASTYLTRANINDFFKRQRMWISIHRFIYNNLKFLIAIGSFLSVTLSILKAILALPAGSSSN